MSWAERLAEKAQKEREQRPPEEDQWAPDPPEACEWPLRACPTFSLPCNKCPYHQETY